MTLIIELAPPLEAKLRTRAAEEGRDEADIARQAVEEYLDSGEPKPAQMTAGARLLAQWEKSGALGIWLDRPESTEELAAEFRRLAESRGSGD
jgi:hypothetical protein